MRGPLQRGSRTTITLLLRVFMRICAKIVDPNDMPNLKETVMVTISIMEIHMPPSFFGVMSHMVLHLVVKLELSGSVHTRWMYNVEKMNKVLKGYLKLNLSIRIHPKLICKRFCFWVVFIYFESIVIIFMNIK